MPAPAEMQKSHQAPLFAAHARVGGVNYIVKPFDLREFAECLRRHLPES